MARTKNTRRGKKKSIKPIIDQNQDQNNPDQLGEEEQSDDNFNKGLLDQADQFLISSDLEKANELCHQVLKSNQTHSRALETLGLIELESGQIKSAQKTFQKCLNSSKSNPSPSVHLYLAQLSQNPNQSLNHFQKALKILKSKLDLIITKKSSILKEDQNNNNSNPTDQVKVTSWSSDEFEIRRSCSRALVGMTEIYLTDLCFDESAEEKCLEYLSMASELDPTDPEPLQTLASVRLSQSELQAAKDALSLSWSLWREKSNRIKTQTELKKVDGMLMDEEKQLSKDQADSMTIDQTKENCEDEGEGEEVLIEDEDQLPPFETRLQWAKLALECEMWSEAIEVLHQCEAEDDEDGEVQYLLAVAWYLIGQSRDPSNPQDQLPLANQSEKLDQISTGQGLDHMECWMEAKECLDTCLQLQERLGDAAGLDQSILNHIKELSAELEKAGITVHPRNIEEDLIEGQELDGDEEDAVWEDASDVSMDT